MNKQNILFRVDASIEMGGGHLIRCLTLAERLRANGHDVAFVSMDLPGSMFELLDSKNSGLRKFLKHLIHHKKLMP